MSPEGQDSDGLGDGSAPQDSGPLSLPAVEARLTSGLWRLESGGPTASTNDDARERAAAGAQEGVVILASAQSSGRGRFSRQWKSPAGGVYLSAVLRPPAASGGHGALPLVIGFGVAQGMASLGAAPTLKWPNDVLIGGCKVAGVLVEALVPAGGRRSHAADVWVIAGVGVNVSRPPLRASPGAASEVPASAGFLADSVPSVTREVAAAAVLEGIASAYRRYIREGFNSLRPEYVRLCDTVGTDVVVSDASGRIVAEGAAVDVDVEGRLALQTASGILAVSSGEVTLKESGGQGRISSP